MLSKPRSSVWIARALINLSVKSKDQVEAPRRDAAKPRTQEVESNGPTTIGDLIKQQLGQE